MFKFIFGHGVVHPRTPSEASGASRVRQPRADQDINRQVHKTTNKHAQPFTGLSIHRDMLLYTFALDNWIA